MNNINTIFDNNLKYLQIKASKEVCYLNNQILKSKTNCCIRMQFLNKLKFLGDGTFTFDQSDSDELQTNAEPQKFKKISNS